MSEVVWNIDNGRKCVVLNYGFVVDKNFIVEWVEKNKAGKNIWHERWCIFKRFNRMERNIDKERDKDYRQSERKELINKGKCLENIRDD